MCVCNVWIDVKTSISINLQGARGHIDGAGQRRPIYVVVITYLQFTGNGMRPSQEPLHRHIRLHVRLPPSELWMVYCLIWFYACALQSNIQIWGHGSILETSGKGFGIASLLTLFYMIIPMSTSPRTPLIHNLFWFCMIGIQFPLGHYDDPFLI